LGIALALAGAEAAAAAGGCAVEMKWPNDLMLGGGKLGGVLVDAQISAGRVTAAILSVGINVNVSVRDLPEDVRESAASLADVTGRTHSLEEIARRLLEELGALWPSVTGDGMALAAAWRRRDALAGREVTVEVAGKRLAGLASGIDAMGRLRLVSGGKEHLLSVGEVTSVRGKCDAGPQVCVE
jgi:BirA family biotin operon repressor/biotin-[acetyl-CoA-carboxylase] ligase